MIRTDIDIKDLVYGILQPSELAGMVSGSVHKDPRPLNSTLEDIVIGILSRDAGAQKQESLVNVNIYVADIQRGREYIENIPRLRELASAASRLFEYINGGDFICTLSSQGILKVDGVDWHIINNRLRIRFNNE